MMAAENTTRLDLCLNCIGITLQKSSILYSIRKEWSFYIKDIRVYPVFLFIFNRHTVWEAIFVYPTIFIGFFSHIKN